MLPFFFCILALNADRVTVLEPDRVFDGLLFMKDGSSQYKAKKYSLQGQKPALTHLQCPDSSSFRHHANIRVDRCAFLPPFTPIR